MNTLRKIDTEGKMSEQWAAFIVENARVVADGTFPRFSRDRADDRFIAAAIAGKAKYIVTGDDDLLSLRDKSPVPIINPRKFVALLSSKE